MMPLGKILMGVAFFGAFNAMSQQKLYFNHDAAGNQVKRTLTLGSPRKQVTDSAAVSSQIGDFKVIVYPNPTQGHLQIEVADFPKDSAYNYSIINTNGVIITSQKLTASKTDADLSIQPVGFYIMHVSIGKKKQTWKIIKE